MLDFSTHENYETVSREEAIRIIRLLKEQVTELGEVRKWKNDPKIIARTKQICDNHDRLIEIAEASTATEVRIPVMWPAFAAAQELLRKNQP